MHTKGIFIHWITARFIFSTVNFIFYSNQLGCTKLSPMAVTTCKMKSSSQVLFFKKRDYLDSDYFLADTHQKMIFGSKQFCFFFSLNSVFYFLLKSTGMYQTSPIHWHLAIWNLAFKYFFKKLGLFTDWDYFHADTEPKVIFGSKLSCFLSCALNCIWEGSQPSSEILINVKGLGQPVQFLSLEGQFLGHPSLGFTV